MFNKKMLINRLFFLLLTTVLLFGTVGCGSSSSSQKSIKKATETQNPVQNTTESNGVITYENYLKIQLDMTYEDVKSIIGEGKKTDLSSDSSSYTWGDAGKTITIQTENGKVLQKSQTMLGKTTSTVTEDQAGKIAKGMSFNDVVNTLGQDYQEISCKKSVDNIRKSYSWTKPNYKNVIVLFQDDKVIDVYNNLK